MTRGVKIGLVVGGFVLIVLPIIAVVVLLIGLGMSRFTPSLAVRREIPTANHGSLIIDGKKSGRSEHGFSQRAGYRPPGSSQIEWFGDVSDGVEPQVYEAGPQVVVIDIPAAVLYVRTPSLPDAVRPATTENWKNFALVFPNDLGPFPISFYAEKSGLTAGEVSKINELGGKREQKWPTTYIQSFDPKTRDLNCSYHVDNTSSWPLHLRLSDDGTRLRLIAIGDVSP